MQVHHQFVEADERKDHFLFPATDGTKLCHAEYLAGKIRLWMESPYEPIQLIERPPTGPEAPPNLQWIQYYCRIERHDFIYDTKTYDVLLVHGSPLKLLCPKGSVK